MEANNLSLNLRRVILGTNQVIALTLGSLIIRSCIKKKLDNNFFNVNRLEFKRWKKRLDKNVKLRIFLVSLRLNSSFF